MKIIKVDTLISCGPFSTSAEWQGARKAIHAAAMAVEHPVGSGTFTINPVRKGNGVSPIKARFVQELRGSGWKTEQPITLASKLRPGNIDFMLSTGLGPIAVEWETGNVSSCQRSMNKLAMGLFEGVIKAGVMIVPSRALYIYLTDRIANYQELAPYIAFWSAIACSDGVLEIVVIEQDAMSDQVPLIPKGTDGRALK